MTTRDVGDDAILGQSETEDCSGEADSADTDGGACPLCAPPGRRVRDGIVSRRHRPGGGLHNASERFAANWSIQRAAGPAFDLSAMVYSGPAD